MLTGAGLSPFFWRVQPVGWLALGAIGFWIRSAAFGNPTLALALTTTLDTLGFIGTSAAAVLHARHAGGARRLHVLLAAGAACVAGAFVLGLLGVAIRDLFPLGASAILPRSTFSLGFVYYLGVLGIWTLAYHGFSAELDVHSERLTQAQARQKELEHLQRQVEPSLVVNTLHAIHADIAARPAQARELTRQLADYLEYALDKRGKTLCSVQDEVAAVRNFVGIQTQRLGERFSCHYDVDAAALDKRLPHMTLPALVEHAVRQAQRAKDAPFHVQVQVWMRDSVLEIEVDNPGHLPGTLDPSRAGPALDNLNQRLAQCYPERYSLTMEQQAGRSVTRLSIHGEPSFA